MDSRRRRILLGLLKSKLSSPHWVFFFQSNEASFVKCYLEKKGNQSSLKMWKGNLFMLIDFLFKSFEEDEEIVWNDLRPVLVAKSEAQCKKAICTLLGNDFVFLRKCALCGTEIEIESHYTCDGCCTFLQKEETNWRECLKDVYSSIQ